MAETTLSVWQKALGEVGTRSTITAADITAVQAGATQPVEAFYCNLFYPDIVTQALRAAHWNFAKTTLTLPLWKALPGTPENTTQPTLSGWDQKLYPAPPWTYSYAYPSACIQARSILGQPQNVPISPPIFSGTTQLSPPISAKLPAGKFEVATDIFDPNGNLVGTAFSALTVTVAAGGTGYAVGDILTIPDSLTTIIPANVQVVTIGGGGAVTTVGPLSTPFYPGIGYFLRPLPTNPVAATGGAGSGATFNLTYTPYGSAQKVILTNLENAILEFTFFQSNEFIWDPDFIQVVWTALAGKLAIPLTGDKALARDKLSLANTMILEARLRDANEGLTINDHVPDWLRTRGVGGGLGYEMYFYPFGPLFPVSPLV